MARGPVRRQSESVAMSPVETPKLPVALYKRTESGNIPTGVHDNQMKAYGFNDLTQYQRPDHYVRYIEPLDLDLSRQVEYDMDEQDEEWLLAMNAERKAQQINTVSYETFEIIMDRLEKEYYELNKHVPRDDFELPSEESFCAICDDSEGENTNAIVFCDGCNLAVHQDCYGVPYIPEGQWLCRKCEVAPGHPVECVLCPNEGGAFKQTTSGDWVHLLCVLWTPNATLENGQTMEPAVISNVDPKREKLKCIICNLANNGTCIQCRKGQCPVAYHVTCARKWKLLLPMKGTTDLSHYCPTHLPEAFKEAHTQARQEAEQSTVAANSKTARAYAKKYKASPPVIPWIIADRITQYISRINVRKKQDFVVAVCKYWSLKREHRRGAPLLKRLHKEAWPSSSTDLDKVATKKRKLEILNDLRDDLETAKIIAELVRKRESRKLKQTLIVHRVLTSVMFSHEAPLRTAFGRIVAIDRTGHFQNPVSRIQVPDYFDIVKNPMCWKVIASKLDKHEYRDLQSFKEDINLVWKNAKLYNPPSTPFYKTAERIETQAPAIFQELEKLASSHYPVTPNGDASSSGHLADVGDLEPPLDVLNMLYEPQSIQDDVEYVIEKDPITTLFNFEDAILKPPPPAPPPPTPPSQPVPLSKKEKKANKSKGSKKKSGKERQQQPEEPIPMVAEVPQEVVDHASGSRGPRKRARSTSGEEEEHWAGQASVPKFAEDVAKMDHFRYFDAGWVLPEGAKRKRASAGGPSMSQQVQLPPPPPPKKRKLNRKKSASIPLRTPTVDAETESRSSMVPETPSEEPLLSVPPIEPQPEEMEDISAARPPTDDQAEQDGSRPDSVSLVQGIYAEGGDASNHNEEHVPAQLRVEEAETLRPELDVGTNLGATADSAGGVTPLVEYMSDSESPEEDPIPAPDEGVAMSPEALLPAQLGEPVVPTEEPEYDSTFVRHPRTEDAEVEGPEMIVSPKEFDVPLLKEHASPAKVPSISPKASPLIRRSPSPLHRDDDAASPSADEDEDEDEDMPGEETPKSDELEELFGPPPVDEELNGQNDTSASQTFNEEFSSSQGLKATAASLQPPSEDDTAHDASLPHEETIAEPINLEVMSLPDDDISQPLATSALPLHDVLPEEVSSDADPVPSGDKEAMAVEETSSPGNDAPTPAPAPPEPVALPTETLDLGDEEVASASVSGEDQPVHPESDSPHVDDTVPLQLDLSITTPDDNIEGDAREEQPATQDPKQLENSATNNDGEADAEGSSDEEAELTLEDVQRLNPGRIVRKEGSTWIIEEIVTPKTRQKKNSKVPQKVHPMRLLGTFPEDYKVPPGTFVWAKAVSPFFYPGIVESEDHPLIPPKLQNKSNKGYPVMFLSSGLSVWERAPNRCLRAFNVHPELDEDMLSSKSIMQGKPFKEKTNQRRAVIENYHIAKLVMEQADAEEPVASGSGTQTVVKSKGRTRKSLAAAGEEDIDAEPAEQSLANGGDNDLPAGKAKSKGRGRPRKSMTASVRGVSTGDTVNEDGNADPGEGPVASGSGDTAGKKGRGRPRKSLAAAVRGASNSALEENLDDKIGDADVPLPSKGPRGRPRKSTTDVIQGVSNDDVDGGVIGAVIEAEVLDSGGGDADIIVTPAVKLKGRIGRPRKSVAASATEASEEARSEHGGSSVASGSAKPKDAASGPRKSVASSSTNVDPLTGEVVVKRRPGRPFGPKRLAAEALAAAAANVEASGTSPSV